MKNRVKELRKARGLRQEDVAALLGVSRQTVNAVENDKYDPTLALGMKLARLLAGMTENFAECFDIESEFHTSGSKSMAQCMEICFWDFTSLKKLFEMILIRTGLYIFLCGTGQKISFLRKLTVFYDLQ